VIFSIGTKVVNIHTGELGTVISLPEMGIIQVKMEDGDIIPVNIEDLVLESAYSPKTRSTGKIDNMLNYEFSIAYPDYKLTNKGCGLALVPKYNNIGEVEYYKFFFINDRPISALISIKLNDQSDAEISGVLKPISVANLQHLPSTAINEQWTITIEKSDIFTSGPDPLTEQRVKLKAKNIFSKEDILPLMDTLGYWLEYKPEVKKETGSDELFELAKTISRNKAHKIEKEKYVKLVVHDPIKRSEFSNELDLHAEALMKDGIRIANDQILQIQLKVFDDYIHQAIRLGIDRVFVIHGLGTGRLKSILHKRLDQITYVKSYNNNWHPSYGFGATEVIFI